MQKWKGLENSNGKIALKTLKWDCRVEDLHCRLISTQEYVNTSKETIEAVYTFSLQRGAVVADFCVVVNGRTLKARIAPRSSADENYESGRITSFDGRAMAVLRTGHETGDARLIISCQGLDSVDQTFAIV